MVKVNSKVFAVLTTTFAITAASMVNASPITVEMQGSWNVQYEYMNFGANFVSLTVPRSFAVTLVFEVSDATSWYVDPGKSYITEYGAPTMSSTVTSYGPGNTLGSSNQSSFTLLSRHNYAEPPDAPAPFQSYQFVNRDYAQLRDATRTQNWSYGLEFHSENQNISPNELRLATANEFVAMLQQAQDRAESFYTSFWKYSYETSLIYGPPVTYTGGIGLSGAAHITSVSAVPEPSILTLLLGGFLTLAAALRLKPRIPNLPVMG